MDKVVKEELEANIIKGIERVDKPKSKTQLLKEAKRFEKLQDKQFAIAVKNRDENKCVICGNSDKVNCHHIIPRENREFRHDLNNGISLCFLHHKFSLEISPHKNALAFFLWLEKNRPEQYFYLKSNYDFESNSRRSV